MLKDLTPEQERLATEMSDISERCYYAGWIGELEYVLWGAFLHGPRTYGHGEVTQQDIQTLKQLSEAAACWIWFDDEREETAISLSAWAAKFEEDIAKHPDFLEG